MANGQNYAKNLGSLASQLTISLVISNAAGGYKITRKKRINLKTRSIMKIKRLTPEEERNSSTLYFYAPNKIFSKQSKKQ